MQTPPSASPSSQAMNGANNNHIAQTPELFPSSLSANRCTPSHLTAFSLHGVRVTPQSLTCAVSLSPLAQRAQSEQRPV